MAAYEYVGNLHVHTFYSDGQGSHAHVAEAARTVGLDFVVFTDHNVRLGNIEGYYGDEEHGYVLILSGEEVHDRTRNPQCNHVLVYDIDHDIAPHVYDLAGLIQTVSEKGGLSFIAHPDDAAVDWLKLEAIPWMDRYIEGFTGLEIWNFMSRFKDYLPNRRTALQSIFRPEEMIVGPAPQTLTLWDQLLELGHRVVVIGNADAHGEDYQLGPISHTVFPYDFLFSCVNTHILTKSPLVGDTAHDRSLLYDALKQGRAFVGYDIPGNTRGFRFTAQGQNTSAIMGESIRLGHAVTLQAIAPGVGRIKIIRYGEVVAEENKAQNATFVVREPGAYRVEITRDYHGTERTWIISNPIYVEPNPGTQRQNRPSQ